MAACGPVVIGSGCYQPITGSNPALAKCVERAPKKSSPEALCARQEWV